MFAAWLRLFYDGRGYSLLFRNIHRFVVYADEGEGIIVVLKEHPLLRFFVVMMKAVGNEQLHRNAVVKGDFQIVQGGHVNRSHPAADDSFAELFSKVPKIVVFLIFAVPALKILRGEQNFVIEQHARHALHMQAVFSEGEHHHFAGEIERGEGFGDDRGEKLSKGVVHGNSF